MKRSHIFRILTNTNGWHQKVCQPFPQEYSFLESILSAFPVISELEWYKNEVLKAREKGNKQYTGINTFECYVYGDKCELFHDYDRKNIQEIPTDIVLNFIDDAIKFHELYNSGGIPGIIPDSKKEDWVIVPKEYVKEEYWETKTEEE